MSEVKTYLRQCRNELKEINTLRSQIEQLHVMMLPSGIRFDDVNVQTSGSGDKAAEMISAAVDLEAKYNKRMAELIVHQNMAAEIIFGIVDSRYRQLLALYYLQGLTFEKVAEVMNYSVEHTIRMHGRALVKASEIYERDHKIS